MFLLGLAAAAYAQTCPDLDGIVDQAQAAFDDAELERAETLIDEGQRALPCQAAPVVTEDLLRLYRLGALVAFSRQDPKGAVYMTIREVVTEPNAPPPANLGPQLLEMHSTWVERLAQSRATLRVDGGGEVWVDGHRVTAEAPYTLLQGEHVIQWLGADGWHSEVRDITGDVTIATGRPLPSASATATSPPATTSGTAEASSGDDAAAREAAARAEAEQKAARDAEKQAAADAAAKAAADREAERRAEAEAKARDKAARDAAREQKRAAGGGGPSAALIVTGGLVTALGGGAIGYGWYEEERFLARDYDADAYGKCVVGQTCYEKEREERILRDATRVRAAYAAGYALTAIGVTVIGLELFVLPNAAAGGGEIGVRGRF